MRTVALAISFVLIGAAAATAATAGSDIHGRGITAESKLYASVLGTDGRPIQVLDRLCGLPETRQHCVSARAALQRAISSAVDRPISWVHHRHRHAGDFWVLSPIRWTPKTASLRYAWDEPGTYGCFGGGRLRYQRDRAAWKLTFGIAYEGCSASNANGSSI